MNWEGWSIPSTCSSDTGPVGMVVEAGVGVPSGSARGGLEAAVRLSGNMEEAGRVDESSLQSGTPDETSMREC